MSESYIILKRKDRFNIESTQCDYVTERDMNLPLCGFSDYKQDLCAGDIIGVILKSNTKIEIEFPEVYCEIVKENKKQQLKELYPKKLKYDLVEEHIFQITKIHKNNEYSVVPVFLDNKVISKKVYLNQSEIKIIPNDFIDREKCLDNCKFWEGFGHDFFHIRRVKKFLNKIDKYFKANEDVKSQYKFFTNKEDYLKLADTERNKAISIPYENYKKFIFNPKNDCEEVKKYFDFLQTNKELLINLFGDDIENKLGTQETLIENSKEITESVFNKEISHEIFYYFTKHYQLDSPKIDHIINKIAFSDIFRVFKTDPKFIGKSFEKDYVRDWSGRKISKKILNCLQEKNHIRIVISQIVDKGWFNTYFKILKKVGDNSYLICSDDPYIYELEDVMFVVNSDVIIELPLEWEGNESLNEIVEFVADEATENKESDMFCELNYDGLF